MPYVFRELGRPFGIEPVVPASVFTRMSVLLAESLSSPVWWDEVTLAGIANGDADGPSRSAYHAS